MAERTLADEQLKTVLVGDLRRLRIEFKQNEDVHKLKESQIELTNKIDETHQALELQIKNGQAD